MNGNKSCDFDEIYRDLPDIKKRQYTSLCQEFTDHFMSYLLNVVSDYVREEKRHTFLTKCIESINTEMGTIEFQVDLLNSQFNKNETNFLCAIRDLLSKHHNENIENSPYKELINTEVLSGKESKEEMICVYSQFHWDYANKLKTIIGEEIKKNPYHQLESANDNYVPQGERQNFDQIYSELKEGQKSQYTILYQEFADYFMSKIKYRSDQMAKDKQYIFLTKCIESINTEIGAIEFKFDLLNSQFNKNETNFLCNIRDRFSKHHNIRISEHPYCDLFDRSLIFKTEKREEVICIYSQFHADCSNKLKSELETYVTEHIASNDIPSPSPSISRDCNDELGEIKSRI